MTPSPIPAEPESLAALREQSARHLHALLVGLAEMGAELAGLYVQRAKEQSYSGQPGAGPSPDCATAFNGVTRSVRRNAMLAQKLLEPAPVPKVDESALRRTALRKQIIRQVEDVLYRDASPERLDSLHAELLERLEGPEFDGELGQRNVAAIVNEICADFGLLGADSLDHWKRRTPRDIAVLCARAAGHDVPADDPADAEGPDWRDGTRIRGP